MKTILKFPVYVEIDSDNVDRRMVTEAANRILYPNLLNFLGNAKYRSGVLKEFRDAAQITNADVKLLTEIDLFKDRS
jgi:hypothetical protein